MVGVLRTPPPRATLRPSVQNFAGSWQDEQEFWMLPIRFSKNSVLPSWSMVEAGLVCGLAGSSANSLLMIPLYHSASGHSVMVVLYFSRVLRVSTGSGSG